MKTVSVLRSKIVAVFFPFPGGGFSERRVEKIAEGVYRRIVYRGCEYYRSCVVCAGLWLKER